MKTTVALGLALLVASPVHAQRTPTMAEMEQSTQTWIMLRMLRLQEAQAGVVYKAAPRTANVIDEFRGNCTTVHQDGTTTHDCE